MTTTTAPDLIITVSQQGPPVWLIPVMVGILIVALVMVWAWSND